MTRLVIHAVILAVCLGPWIARGEDQEVTAALNPMPVDPHEYIERIRLPEGFRISIFADGVTGARSMTLSPAGVLYVGTHLEWGKPPYGKVYAIRDNDGDFKADEVITVAEGLNVSNGVAFHDGDLYVAEINRILLLPDIERDLHDPPEPVVLNDGFPEDFHHGWKFIRFGPDGRLYVPVGAPCNICEVQDPHGTIVSIKPDGSDLRVYARGIRNSVGFDWHPDTGELWFTDNGRDAWGNNRPPEELNHAPRPGLHFGYPYRYGKDVVDDTFAVPGNAPDFAPAALEFPAHNALLGIRFYTGSQFPEPYRKRIFIASHGSWNRDPPDGYRVYTVRMADGVAAGYEVFASGWLVDEKFWGRPVDVQVMPDGSLLVSDDFAHVIYRISYEK